MDFSAQPQEPPNPEETPLLDPPPTYTPNPVFYGKDGIRSGWRILLYIAFFVLLSGVEVVLFAFFPQTRNPLSISAILLGEAASFAAAFGAAIMMSRIEALPIALYGLPLHSAFGKRFWQGMFLGLSEISLLVGAMKLFGSYSFGTLSFRGTKIVEWALLWLVAAVLIALAEEFHFRGYVQFTLGQGIGFWPAAVILSLLFGGIHITNKGENWVGVVCIVFTGLLWAFTLRRTGSLWLAVGWHAAFDFGESFLYSVPNSGGVFEGHLSNATVESGRVWLTGGKVGPEASVFAFATLALGAIVIHFWFPAKPKTEN